MPTRRRHRSWWRAAAALAAVALVAGACGDDDDDAPSSSGSGTPTTEAAADDSAAPATDGDTATSAASGDSGDAASGDDDPLAPQPLDERRTVRVAWPVGVEAFASVIVADALGEFDAENIEIEYIVVPPSEAIALLETDRADMWVSSINATIFNALAADVDLRWIAPTFYPNPESLSGLWLRNELFLDNGDVDVDALRDSTLGLGGGGVGASTTPLIDRWLQSIGVSLSEIDVDSSLNGAEILIGLENGAIDGGWLSDPVWITAQESGSAQPVVTQAGDFGNYALSGYITHGRMFEGDNRAVTEAFVRALARANRDHLQGDYHTNDAVVEAIAEAAGTPADDIRAALPLRFDPTLVIDPEIVDILQATWLSAGDILEYTEPIPADELIDQSVLPGS